MESSATTGHSYIDVAFTFLMAIAGSILMNIKPVDPALMQWIQIGVWAIAGTSGILAIMNHVGYVPGWLATVKKKVKKKKHE